MSSYLVLPFFCEINYTVVFAKCGNTFTSFWQNLRENNGFTMHCVLAWELREFSLSHIFGKNFVNWKQRFYYIAMYSVEITKIYSPHYFFEKFRESNIFTKEITKSVIWRNFTENLAFFPHCRVVKTEIYSHTFLAEISWKQHV